MLQIKLNVSSCVFQINCYSRVSLVSRAARYGDPEEERGIPAAYVSSLRFAIFIALAGKVP